MYTPYFTVTNKITKYIEDISVLLGELKTLNIPPNYRKQLISKITAETVHSSTAIEGNTLTQKQVEDVLNGKPIHAINQDIQEVKNYNEAIKLLDNIIVTGEGITEKVVRQIHQIVLKEIDRYEAGKYRTIPVRVGNYLPPESFQIPILMKEFTNWITTLSPKNLSTFLYAGIVHYHFVEIHPFKDGNGRTSRLLTKLFLLQKGYDIRSYFSLESFYNRDRKAYYNALESAYNNRVNGNPDLTNWLEYFLYGLIIQAEGAKSRIEELNIPSNINTNVKESITPLVHVNNHQRQFLKLLNKNSTATRGEYIKLSKLSPKAVNINLNVLINMELIERHGEFKRTYYTLTVKGRGIILAHLGSV